MLRSVLVRSVPTLGTLPRVGLARSVPPLAMVGRRHMCDWDVQLKNAYVTMSLQPDVSAKQVKKRFYELAKSCHPDVQQGAAARQAQMPGQNGAKYEDFGSVLEKEVDPAVRYLEIQAAYELLMEAIENGGPGGADTKKKKRNTGPKARAKTLGEVLCERLRDEPEEVESVWEDIKMQKLGVSHDMVDRLFRAHATQGRVAKDVNVGMPAGLGLLQEGCELGLISQSVRAHALQHLLVGWRDGNEDYIVDVVVENVTDADRESTAVMAAIGAVFCSGTRSPY